MFFSVFNFFSLTGHQAVKVASGQISSYLAHQVNIVLSLLNMTRDGSTTWCRLSTTAGTTPHCLDNTEGNVNILRNWKLVYALVNTREGGD